MHKNMSESSFAVKAEDHALVSVPLNERKSGYHLSMSTIGVATALAIFAIGGFSVILAGFKAGVTAGIVSGILSFILGKLLAQIAFRTGMSSTLTLRFYGLGFKGSALGSFIFSFLVLGFLALENALLYEGTLLMFDLHDTLAVKLGVYTLLTFFWVSLAIFGIRLALRSSALLTFVTLLITFFLIYQIYVMQGVSFNEVLAFKGIVPGNGWTKFEAAFALTGGTAGSMALISADFGRYSRSSKDVTILAALGPMVQNVFTVILGALIFIGSLPQIVNYLIIKQPGLAPEAARAAAQNFAMGNTGAYYVILAGWLGFITIYAAQAKAQTINAYSGSLALVNLVDTLLGIRPGRAVMVILGNLIALAMIAVGILESFTTWIAWLGCMTMALCGTMIADFYLVQRGKAMPHKVENWNWAGVLSLIISTTVGIWLINTNIFICGFVITLILALILYPILRTLIPSGTGTRYIQENTAIKEAV
ncbi:hypothetical protein QMR30_004025 [Salmonella enterica]|nr:hypothetical protein [Salmonella enterica]ELJ4842936.1 hypothetical protein [Salmonella enterica]